MKGKNLKDLFKKKATKAGAIFLATAIVFGGSVWTENQSSVPELTKFVDTVETEAGTVEIDAEGTPLAGTKVTTTSKTTKKTKKVKLKTKSTKTYSKKSATKKTTKTTKKNTASATTTTKTVTASSMTSSFKKGSNINTQVTTTKTTVTTTVVSKASASASKVSTSTAASKVANGEIALSAAAPKLKSNIATAYKTLNFKIVVDSSVSYSGLFDARSQTITLKTLDDTVYHELGHFVAFAAGNVDTSADFQKVFAQEKSKYTAYNKTYVLQNSSEYFAESFKEYTLNPATLKAQRPLTYAAIEKAVAAVTTAQTAKLKAVYSSIWS